MTADSIHLGQNWEAVLYCTIMFSIKHFQLQESSWPIWEHLIDAVSKRTHVFFVVMFW